MFIVHTRSCYYNIILLLDVQTIGVGDDNAMRIGVDQSGNTPALMTHATGREGFEVYHLNDLNDEMFLADDAVPLPIVPAAGGDATIELMNTSDASLVVVVLLDDTLGADEIGPRITVPAKSRRGYTFTLPLFPHRVPEFHSLHLYWTDNLDEQNVDSYCDGAVTGQYIGWRVSVFYVRRIQGL